MKYHKKFLLREEGDACNCAPRHHHLFWICCEFLSELVPLLTSYCFQFIKKAKIAKYTLAGMLLQIFKRVHDLTKNKRSNNMQQIANFKALKMITKDLLLRFQGSDARKQTPATQAATALSSIFAPQIRWAAKNCRKSRHKQPLHWIDGMSGTKLLHKQRTLLYYIFIYFPFFMSLSMVITWLNLVLIDVAHW